jgi:prolipoprotein diacylglyceryltransferase
VGERIVDGTCFEGYCTHLVPGVYPTPLYESIACLLLFAVLWRLRTRLTTPGVLFCIYLIMNGIERFFIEKIRVNEPFLGTFTQAEVISTLLFLTGVGGILWLRRRKTHGPEAAH